MNRQFRQRLLTSTLFVGASLLAAPALAQDPSAQTPSPPDNSATPEVPETTTPVEGQTTIPSTSAEGETVESSQDIVVTGSRIPQPNLTSASPVTVVTAQEVKLSGTTRTEDLINALPQSFAAQGSNISNGATGAATVNLRGLGTSRTLVLVNGRRLHAGDPRDPVADINFIPAPLIKRVDVLTGGASSVYGADAVAGVVNFIMDTNFRGLRIDAQASAFMHDNDTEDHVIAANEARGFRPPRGTSINGGAQDIAVAFGAGFDDNRGNIMAYATYRKQRPVLQSTRDYSFCALSARATRDPRSWNCGGSGTSAGGTFITNVGVFTVGPNQTFVPSNATTNPPFNFAPYNFYQRPDERYTLGAFAEYEISEGAKPYIEAMFMDDRSLAQIAPSGNFFATGNVNCDNPLLSAQQLATICIPANTFVQNGVTRAVFYPGRRNVEGGGRQDDLQHTAYRIVGGIRGDFLRGVSYDAYYQYGITNLAETYLNDFSITRLGRALDVVDDPNQPGINPVCRSVLDGTDPNCVPYNIFVTGGVTQAALDYLQTPGFLRGDIRQSIANANLTFQGGEYGLQLPWANRGLGINLGAEYRKESLNFDTDLAFSTGDLAGQGGPTIGVEGSFDVSELFAEIDLPIVTESFIHELSLQAGYRYSAYDVGENNFNTNTYKIAAELAPVQDVRFRGSYNRAVRAPNIIELFTPQAIQLDGTADPCAGILTNADPSDDPTATLAQCQLQGVTAAQYGNILDNPAGQYNVLAGGNPNLAPEKADSLTLGAVLQPRFIPGLAVTVDWFKIKIKNQIGASGFDAIMGDCLTGDAFACSLINRNPQGSLWLTGGFIETSNQNFPGLGLQTEGIDVQASYARQIGRLGNLNLSLVGTKLEKLGTADADGDCVGFFSGACGTPNPEWRHKFRVGFTLPNGLGLSGQWRYFSAVECYSVPEGTGNCALPANARFQAQSYFDLAMQARITNRYNFRIGANNILDKEPPLGGQVIGAGSGNGNTYPQVYDALGRYIFAGVTLDF